MALGVVSVYFQGPAVQNVIIQGKLFFTCAKFIFIER